MLRSLPKIPLKASHLNSNALDGVRAFNLEELPHANISIYGFTSYKRWLVFPKKKRTPYKKVKVNCSKVTVDDLNLDIYFIFISN